MSASIIVGGVLGVIDRIFPNPKDAADAKLKVLEMEQNGELAALQADMDLAKGQMAVNKEEAKTANPLMSGWRPFIGWVCGSAFAFNFVILPLITSISALMGSPVEIASLDMTEMMPVLLGMLGLGGFRTYEKYKNCQGKH